MNWEAATHDEARRQDHADSDWYAREATWLFMDGARWQRSALTSDEAVERVAEAIWSTDPAPALTPFDGPDTWEGQEPEMKNDYRKAARTVIAALIREAA